MHKCSECKYIRSCKQKAECPDLWGCTSGVPIEKMGIRTNGDAIRAMTNAELAEFLANYEMDLYVEIGVTLLSKKEYLNPMLEWLESEVENG